jgi:hypothetical protein
MLVRRMATVTISAPLASIASRVCVEVAVLARAHEQADGARFAVEGDGGRL